MRWYEPSLDDLVPVSRYRRKFWAVISPVTVSSTASKELCVTFDEPVCGPWVEKRSHIAVVRAFLHTKTHTQNAKSKALLI